MHIFVTIKNHTMKKKNELHREAAGVLLRIGVFIIYYILLILIGIAAVVATIALCTHIFPIVSNLNPRAMITVFVVIGCLCFFIFMFSWYLIKPLFSFTADDARRVEVTEEECPRLFEIIAEVARETQCPLPKHVFLSERVNACVFYDTRFWNIFFPVRKNLEIGLGLFESISVDELKAVIGHEFGHFSQKSMKLGSSVSVTNTVLYNLIYTKDSWDDLLERWCSTDFKLVRMFGVLTRAFTGGIKRLTVHVFRFVEKGYLRLSRQMEYDADAIACESVGPDVFISALCKLEVLANRESLYQDCLRDLMEDGKIVSDYFAGLRTAEKLSPDGIDIRFDTRVAEPFKMSHAQSRIEIQDIWSSHPSLNDRIRHIHENFPDGTQQPHEPQAPESAWVLLPKSTEKKVSDYYIALLKEDYPEPLSPVSDKEFGEWTEKEIHDNILPPLLQPFFSHVIDEVDTDRLKCTGKEKNPFTVENARTEDEYRVAIEDWSLLQQVELREVEAKDIRYNGMLYSRKRLPIEEHREYLATLEKRVVQIDGEVYLYLLSSQEKEEGKARIKYLYDAMRYTHEMLDHDLQQLSYRKDKLIQELQDLDDDSDELSAVIASVTDYEKTLRGYYEKAPYSLFSLVLDDKTVEYLKAYAEEQHNPTSSLDEDALNQMFHLADVLIDIHRRVYAIVRREIAMAALSLYESEEKRKECRPTNASPTA